MRPHLQKLKNRGDIDFIQVPLEWGRCHHEFIIYSLKRKRFSRIFFDNKYREDYQKPDMVQLKKEIDDLELGLNDLGIYNTREQYKEKKKLYDFVYRYEYPNCG
jgi:hypothetical protein